MKNRWPTKKIGDVCNLMTGGTPSKEEEKYFGGDIRWLVSGDIHKGEIFECEGRITEEGMKNSNAKILPVNSVMIALNGQGKTRGTVALLRMQATCNQSLVSIYPNNSAKLLPEFLYINLHGRYQEIRQMTGDSGNDRRGLNMGLIKNIEIPVPSIPEQQRIVNILTKAFEAIAIANANAEKNLQNARVLFESHHNVVFTQRDEGWANERLGNLFVFKNGRAFKKEEWGSGGLPIIRIQNLNKIDSSYNYYAGEYTDDILIRNGDLLFSWSGTVGSSFGPHIWQRGNGLLNQHIFKVSLKTEMDRRYAYYALEKITKKIEEQVNGAVGLVHITKEKLNDFKIPAPPIKEQRLIVNRLDNLRTETQRLESLYQRKLTALDELKKSLLNQAFSGNL